MWRQRSMFWFTVLLMLFVAPPAVCGGNIFDELTPEEIAGEHYFQLVDEQGNLITTTGHRLRAGDSYLASDNRLYEVETVDKYIARARFKEEVKLKVPSEASKMLPAVSVQAQSDHPSRTIAIYHTHNAECYVPSDGQDSVYGHGGIHAVGRAFRDALKAKGIKVLYSEHMHLPHDRGAYRRSRVTAASLLRRHPDAIFDLHRDAAPPETYSLQMDSEWLTKIQIVVGEDNPHQEVNQGFAYDLKGYCDWIYPGLIKGILVTFGDFNQDLSPLSLLLEVGAHTNTKEAAENGIVCFSDVVAYYFYGPDYLPGSSPEKIRQKPPALYHDAGGINKRVTVTVLGLMIVGLGLALGFTVVNEPQILPDTVDYWRGLPDRLTWGYGHGKQWFHNFPDLISRSLKDYPQNLARSCRHLGEEISRTKNYFREELPKFREDVSRKWPEYRRILHNNRVESWNDLHRQSESIRKILQQMWARLFHR